ncbi:MAG: endonuclease domain-containing protein [Pseudolabrys sp.]|nr:endonuclease domain-containing protein [Pseudolabrys sp.]
MSAGVHHRPVRAQGRAFAKRMRRTPTDAEVAMWRLLRNRRLAAFKFRRRVPFQRFILDYVCFDPKTVIEIDGSQHAGCDRDRQRDAILETEGFAVLRYWNNDVLQRRTAVLEDIHSHLTGRR